MSNAKQFHKTKEQIIAEKDQRKKIMERMDFINNKFMPAMEIAENLEEAQMITESLKSAINQAFVNKSKEMKVSELGLMKSLQNVKKPELVYKHIQILSILEDQTIDDAIRLCDGLYAEVDRTLMEEKKNKKISDFNKHDRTKSTGATASTE